VSKVVFVPLPPEEFRDSIYSVVGGAIAGGAPTPSWVAIDDGTDSWVAEVLSRPAAHRARSVIAAACDEALVKAQRLGIGGALRLPPSSLGAIEAFTAADSTEAPVSTDAAALELLEQSASAVVVSFCDRQFWRAQIGDRAMVESLFSLASALGVPATVVGWPALVVAGRDEAEIAERWEEISPVGDGVRLVVSRLPKMEGAAGSGALESVYETLLENRPAMGSTAAGQPRPVHELPHGRRVGWWNVHREPSPEEDGWLATPLEITPSRCSWRLEGAGEGGEIAEVLSGEGAEGAGDVVALRIPGWAARSLRPGNPAGLLASRIAESAARRGLPLWIPGVDQEGLRFVLGLPGTIWVDGPAVPD
jgi:hypothetical protein